MAFCVPWPGLALVVDERTESLSSTARPTGELPVEVPELAPDLGQLLAQALGLDDLDEAPKAGDLAREGPVAGAAKFS
jgi:hypothetical protein